MKIVSRGINPTSGPVRRKQVSEKPTRPGGMLTSAVTVTRTVVTCGRQALRTGAQSGV